MAGLVDAKIFSFGDGITVAAPANTQVGYLVSYNALGVAQWVRQLGTIRKTGGNDFAVAADAPRSQVYSTGNFTDNTVLYQTTAQGAAGWVVQATGTGQLVGRAVAVEATTGDVYVAGTVRGTVQLGNFALNGAGANANDGFVARLSAQGAVSWALTVGGAPGEDAATHLRTDLAGNVYVGGYFTGSGTFGPGGNAPLTSSPGDAQNVFLASYSPQGVLRWAQRAGGSLSQPRLASGQTVTGLDYAASGRLVLSVVPYAQTYTYGATTVLTGPVQKPILLILNINPQTGALQPGTRQARLESGEGNSFTLLQSLVTDASPGAVYFSASHYGGNFGGCDFNRASDTFIDGLVGRLGSAGLAPVLSAAGPAQRGTAIFPVPVSAGQALRV